MIVQPALPPAPLTVQPHLTPTVLARTQEWQSYVVRPGDTVWEIAARAHTTVEAIVSRNDLPRGGALIRPGQRLQIPGAATSASTPKPATSAGKAVTKPATRTTTYVVRSGDTLGAIAARLRTSVDVLTRINRLANPHRIHIGQRLLIPVAGSAAATKTPSGAHSTPRKATTPAKAPAKPARNVPNTFLGRTYPAAVAEAAADNREALAKIKVPTREQTKALIITVAKRHGVDPTLALAVGWQESGWDQRQVSPANAIGIMQVIPSSGQWASTLLGRKLNLMEPEDNVTAGVVILRTLLRMATSEDQAIAGYYQGLGSVRSHGMYADTVRYVRNVQALRQRM
jgi:LysM repeat protein